MYTNWAGLTAGENDTQSNAFVAVTADTTVPTANGCDTNELPLSAWIGLGGTSSGDNLVQQGEICGDTDVSTGGGFRPFEEFAYALGPVAMCGDTSVVFEAGDVLYQQMSYETGSNVANFYIEDETTGVAVGCPASPPLSQGWSFDGTTGDFVVETSAGFTVPFSTIDFSNAQVEWGSSGDWAAFGSRPTTKLYDGFNPGDYCAGPSTIGSDEESFSVSYSTLGDCQAA